MHGLIDKRLGRQSHYFMVIISNLMLKNLLPDQIKMSNLVKIPKLMNLEMITRHQHQGQIAEDVDCGGGISQNREEQVLGDAFKMLCICINSCFSFV